MGCAQSKIEQEDSVVRCKNRKLYMRDAVASRHAFAAAHAAYAVALKNTGAALLDFGHSEFQDLNPSQSHSDAPAPAPSSSSSSGAVVARIQPPMDTLPPPPPPPPSDSSAVPAPIARAASMPAEIAISKSKKKPPKSETPVDDTIREEDEGERANDDRAAAASSSPAPPPQPQQDRAASPPPVASEAWDYFFRSNEHMSPTLSQPEETTWTDTKEVEQVDKIKSKTTTHSPPASADDVRGDETLPVPAKPAIEPPPTPSQQVKKIKQSAAVDQKPAAIAGASVTKKSNALPATVNLNQILVELDDHFLKASESAQDVSNMLEAPRMHYHSNFADNRDSNDTWDATEGVIKIKLKVLDYEVGLKLCQKVFHMPRHIDHSAILMRVITWNRSLKGLSQLETGKHDFDNDEWETHATILDKMLAWEKKLYDEVKAGEVLKVEYQKKLAQLNKLKKTGGNSAALAKIKAAVSHLHTRYIVDVQSMDATLSEISRLRDHCLYVKMMELVNGMAKMWETMCSHHRSQYKLVKDIRSIEIQLAPRETSQQHHNKTIQLRNMLEEWESHFQKLTSHQKEYIKCLNSWLNLNLVPIERSLKETPSPQWQLDPPIKDLLREWLDHLENLPTNQAKGAISTFFGAIHAIVLCQVEELNLKLKWEEARRDHQRKRQDFEEWYRKYMEKKASSEEVNVERSEEAYQQDHVTERKNVVEHAKSRLKEAEESYRKQCKLVRDKALSSLRTYLPDLFKQMSDFASSCSVMYKKLSSPAESKT